MRSLAVGIASAAAIGLGSTYNDMIIKGSGLAVWNLTPAAIFLFFLLVAVVNVGLGWLRPGLALEREELAVAFFVMLLGNTLSSRGLPAQLLPVITGVYYYATPENDWADLLQPYLPAWPVPQGDDVIRGFYEGSSDGAVPWGAWIEPLCYWAIFGLALFLVMVCLMVIVRRQWVEHERLAYPMVQLPLAMLERAGAGVRLPPLFRSPVMWIGFALPVILASVNALHNYFVVFPRITLGTGSIPMFRGTASIRIYLNLSMLGFSYFIPQNVSLGLSFFHLLNVVCQGVLGVLGLGTKDDRMGAYSQYTDPIIIYQAMGAMIVLVLGFLWIGRGHLRQVWRKAWHDDPSVDDSDEIMSYRAALGGTAAGFLVLGYWLWQTGIPMLFVPLVLFSSFVVFMTIARVAAQGGVAAMFPPTSGADFTAAAVGASLLGARGMAGLALTYAWCVDTLILLMSACANGLKLLTEVRVPHLRRVTGGVVAVIVVTLACVVGLTLVLGYRHGAINLSGFYFNNVAQYPYRFMAHNVLEPGLPSLSTWIHTATGGLIMVGLMVAQYRWLWWPFHAVGFPVSCVFGKMWFSVFVAWIIKGVVLKYGGLSLFNWLRPFFLGLILGEAVIAGTWVLVDYFSGMNNNYLGGIVFQ